MYKPNEAEALINLIPCIEDAGRGCLGDEKEYLRRKAAVDLDIIARYAAYYLSNPNYPNEYRTRPGVISSNFTERAKDLLADDPGTKVLVNEHPEYTKTLSVIDNILFRYFQDLEYVTVKSEQAQLSVQKMREDAESGFFEKEYIAFMMHGHRQGQGTLSEFWASGLNNAHKNMAFTGGQGKNCPMSEKMRILMFSPERIAPDRVEITGKAPGALPAFIHNEIVNGPTIETDRDHAPA